MAEQHPQSTEEASEIETIKIKRTLWMRIRDVVLGIGFVIISIGTFNDFKDVIGFAYENFITHFTDEVEFEKLAEVSVGANPEYLEQVFGVARLIKASRVDDSLEYRYYDNDKFLLGLAVEKGRVRGYLVTSMRAEFLPQISFSDRALGTANFATLNTFNGQFTTDNTNLVYYLEGQQMGRQGLFLNRYIGYLDYAATYPNHEQTLTDISALNDDLVLGAEEQVVQRIDNLRSRSHPNFYVIGDFAIETAADMALTRFEYQAYFGD